MADPEHIKILKKGAKVWNQWRAENTNVQVDLQEFQLSHVNLRGGQLGKANLNGGDFSDADLKGADLRGSHLSNTDFSRTDLRGSNLTHSILRHADFFAADLRSADLSGADLSGADLSGADLRDADLRGSKIINAVFFGANLSTAQLDITDVSSIGNCSYIDLGQDLPFDERQRLDGRSLIKNGVEIWNQWRAENPDILLTLSKVDLSGDDLQNVDFCDVDLSEAFLKGCTLRAADLNGAILSNVDLSYADISFANLYQADLSLANLKEAVLNGSDFSYSNLNSATLRRAQLKGSEFDGADLRNADLDGADLFEASLRSANLNGADLSNINLNTVDLIGADLTGINLSRTELKKTNIQDAKLCKANLRGSDFRGINFQGMDLRGADLAEANLDSVDLSYTDLRDADLSKTQCLGTNFSHAKLTGACIKDWNINSNTNLESIKCEYIYLENNREERRPHDSNFRPGEFTQRFQQYLDTVDLFFADGVDWKAFLASFQDLQSQYGSENVAVQGIERKGHSSYEVRIAVSPETNKADVERIACESYKVNIKHLESQHQKQLSSKDEEVRQYKEKNEKLTDELLCVYRRQQNTYQEQQEAFTEVAKLLASRPINVKATAVAEKRTDYRDFRNAQFAGGYAERVQGSQDGGTINNLSNDTLSPNEAIYEIQELLKQLQASNPTATDAEKTVFLNVMIPSTQRERFLSAIKVANGTAQSDVPYGAIIQALIDSWAEQNR